MGPFNALKEYPNFGSYRNHGKFWRGPRPKLGRNEKWNKMPESLKALERMRWNP